MDNDRRVARTCRFLTCLRSCGLGAAPLRSAHIGPVANLIGREPVSASAASLAFVNGDQQAGTHAD
jgi:hypothetical protein